VEVKDVGGKLKVEAYIYDAKALELPVDDDKIEIIVVAKDYDYAKRLVQEMLKALKGSAEQRAGEASAP
jgi:hypothetical protein